MSTLTKLSRDYIDLDFSFQKHPITNSVSIKKQLTSVKQSIMHLLTLREGDKPFHPEIKSPIYDYLFENTSVVMKVVLESEIRKYLSIFEPRIEIESVFINFPNVNEISCGITGKIVNTTEPFDVNILINRLR